MEKRLRFSHAITPDMRFGREPRYRCLQCEDTGFVTIWKPGTIHQATRDPDQTDWLTCVVLCDCDAAKHRVQKIGKRQRTLPIFGLAAWHIRVRDDDSKVQAAVYDEVSNDPRYNNEFTEWAK